MIGWLYRLIVGRFSHCLHEYEIIKQKDMVADGCKVVGLLIISRCKKCGDIKVDEIGVK